MPTYKLTYFNGRGRGECSRVLFAAAGKKFEDVRLNFEDWPAFKPKTPQGTLPVLEIDGKSVSQSTAVARHLAREFKLYGKNDMEATYIDQIFDTLVGLFDTRISLVFSKAADKDEQMKQFNEEKLPKVLEILEKLVIEAGKGFAVGNALSLADVALYVYLEGVSAEDSLGKCPKLEENRKKVAAVPRIAEWLKKRPVTDF